MREWERDDYAQYLTDRLLYVVSGNSCTLINSMDGENTDSQPIYDLYSEQEEADTKILLHCKYISRNSSSVPIIKRSPDTDVFILLLAFASKFETMILFDTGTANSRRLLNISKLSNTLSENFCQALIGFHSFTGCDTTSSFAGKGKIRPLSILQKDDEMVQFFKQLGQCDILEEDAYLQLEKFVCLMYGYSTSQEVDTVRCDIVKKRFTSGDDRLLNLCKGIDLTQLPPCRSILRKHIKRAH